MFISCIYHVWNIPYEFVSDVNVVLSVFQLRPLQAPILYLFLTPGSSETLHHEEGKHVELHSDVEQEGLYRS
jgi:hypothetical protein